MSLMDLFDEPQPKPKDRYQPKDVYCSSDMFHEEKVECIDDRTKEPLGKSDGMYDSVKFYGKHFTETYPDWTEISAKKVYCIVIPDYDPKFWKLECFDNVDDAFHSKSYWQGSSVTPILLF